MEPLKKQFFNTQGSNKFPQEMLEFLNQNTVVNIDISYDPAQAGIIYDVSYYEQRSFAETLNMLSEISRSRNNRKGFHDDDIFMENLPLTFDLGVENTERFKKIWTRNRKLARIALIMSELGEVVEGIRKDAQDDKLPHRKSEVVELADTVERIFDYTGFYWSDLGNAHTEKTAYNESRPYKHGKLV
jgi:NTP pyrophosphatase (non-canonical NTP hydrolase)